MSSILDYTLIELQPTPLPTTLTTVLPSSNINFRKKDDFASNGIVPEHQRIGDYLTTPHKTSNNFSSSTAMIASKLSYKA
jgi:hypothetical protein